MKFVKPEIKDIKSILPFLPLLVIYLIVIAVFSTEALVGDESRYLRYAGNILNGFFTDVENPELANGPGYPLILAFFLALKLNYVTIKIFNAIFVFVGVHYFYRTLALFINNKYALAAALLFGLYPPMIRFIPLMHTESVTVLLICVFIYYICKLYQAVTFKWSYVIGASLSVAFLAMVKLIFVHVILFALIALTVATLFGLTKKPIRPYVVILFSLLFIAPYLVYAYSLTGKILYIGTGGGEIIYYRSTPYEGEWGNWFSKEAVHNKNLSAHEAAVYSDLTALSVNHEEFYNKIDSLSYMERDSVFKAQGIQNIKNYPGKYVKNTLSNLGRLLFHFPFSYRSESMAAYGYMLPNMFLVVFCVLSLFPLLLSKKKIPAEIWAIVVFILAYGCAIVILDGRGRNFIVMVPALMLFTIYVFTHLLRITILDPRKGEND